MNIAISVAKWLLGLPHIMAVAPVSVKIGHRTYSAARYTESHNGVNEERLYVVGEMPPFHSQMRRICYRTDNSEYAWHLIAWFRQKATCTEWRQVHPFGTHFILALWSPIENWATDQYQAKPYRRIPMIISPCGGPNDVSVDQPSLGNEQWQRPTPFGLIVNGPSQDENQPQPFGVKTMPTTITPKFNCGAILATRGASEAFERSHQMPLEFLQRHCLAIGVSFAKRTAKQTSKLSSMVLGCSVRTASTMGPRSGALPKPSARTVSGKPQLFCSHPSIDGTRPSVKRNRAMQDASTTEVRNYYECPECGVKWTAEWDSMCNDRCPKCSTEIEPYDSVKIGPPPTS